MKRKLTITKNSLIGIVAGKISLMMFALLMLFPWTGSAQKVSADSTHFYIGQQINLILELQVKKGDLVNWPAFQDTITRSIEIVNAETPDTISGSAQSQLIIRQKLTITSFDTGFQVVPPIAFAVKQAGSDQFTNLMSEPLLLEVRSVMVNEKAEIKGLKPVMEAPYTFRDFLPWILLLLALLLIGVLVWFFIQNRKKKQPLIKLPSRPQKPAHVLALEQLTELKLQQLWQKGQVKDYYTRLTDILRAYLEARFGVMAAEMTSDEIMLSTRHEVNDSGRLADLKKILSLSDMAKFAKARPQAADNELSHTLAVAFVNGTSQPVATNKDEAVKNQEPNPENNA